MHIPIRAPQPEVTPGAGMHAGRFSEIHKAFSAVTGYTMFGTFETAIRSALVMCLVVGGTLCGVPSAWAADDVRVKANVTDAGVAVTASAHVRAPFSVIWRTLTDYDHLAEFIPGMKMSRLIARSGSVAVVEQAGIAGNFFLNYPINVVVEAHEQPPSTITLKILSGNLRTLEGAYHLQKVAEEEDTFILSWKGMVQPEIDLPEFVETWALQQNVLEQFRGMINEIERQARRRMS